MSYSDTDDDDASWLADHGVQFHFMEGQWAFVLCRCHCCGGPVYSYLGDTIAFVVPWARCRENCPFCRGTRRICQLCGLRIFSNVPPERHPLCATMRAAERDAELLL